MKKKTRHDLYLSEDLSRQLDELARSMGKSRSEVVNEAVRTWFATCATYPGYDDISLKLIELERQFGWNTRPLHLPMKAMIRLLQSLPSAPPLPPASDEAVRTAAVRMFDAIIEDALGRLEGKEPGHSDEPAAD